MNEMKNIRINIYIIMTKVNCEQFYKYCITRLIINITAYVYKIYLSIQNNAVIILTLIKARIFIQYNYN